MNSDSIPNVSLNPESRPLNTFDWRSIEYCDAYNLFLRHTDQKHRLDQYISQLLSECGSRGLFVDAGAGNGVITAEIARHFRRVLAIEPNRFLFDQLAVGLSTCKKTRTSDDLRLRCCKILDVEPSGESLIADFVLCSHVLYYVDESQLVKNVVQLGSWLADGGILLVAIQSPRSDIMRLTEYFCGGRSTLLLDRMRAAVMSIVAKGWESRVVTIESSATTPHFPTACDVAEWMLAAYLTDHADPSAFYYNLARPDRAQLERYVSDRFLDASHGYRFSCDQDVIVVRKPTRRV